MLLKLSRQDGHKCARSSVALPAVDDRLVFWPSQSCRINFVKIDQLTKQRVKAFHFFIGLRNVAVRPSLEMKQCYLALLVRLAIDWTVVDLKGATCKSPADILSPFQYNANL